LNRDDGEIVIEGGEKLSEFWTSLPPYFIQLPPFWTSTHPIPFGICLSKMHLAFQPYSLSRHPSIPSGGKCLPHNRKNSRDEKLSTIFGDAHLGRMNSENFESFQSKSFLSTLEKRFFEKKFCKAHSHFKPVYEKSFHHYFPIFSVCYRRTVSREKRPEGNAWKIALDSW
jgi:hypothetical protein